MRVFTLTLLVLSSRIALADGASHQINTAPVRGFVQNHLVDAQSRTLRVGPALDTQRLPSGVTPQAAAKAAATLRGMTGFNRGVKAGNSVVTMGKEKLVLTASSPGQRIGTVGSASADPAQEFVLRTGKTGSVVARGNLDGTTGKLTFTRSHNTEHVAEVNAAAK